MTEFVIYICDSRSLGDEFHYLFQCSYFENERKMLLPKEFISNPNIVKFHDLFNTDNYNVMFKVAKCCKIVLSVVK